MTQTVYVLYVDYDHAKDWRVFASLEDAQAAGQHYWDSWLIPPCLDERTKLGWDERKWSKPSIPGNAEGEECHAWCPSGNYYDVLAECGTLINEDDESRAKEANFWIRIYVVEIE